MIRFVRLAAFIRLAQLAENVRQRQARREVVRFEGHGLTKPGRGALQLPQRDPDHAQVVGPGVLVGGQQVRPEIKRLRQLVALVGMEDHAQPAVGLRGLGLRTHSVHGRLDLFPRRGVELILPRSQVRHGRKLLG